MVEYIVAIDVTRVRFPADAIFTSNSAVLEFMTIRIHTKSLLASCMLCSSDGVTVSTLDFESSDGGSNPPRSYYVDTKIVIRNLIVIT